MARLSCKTGRDPLPMLPCQYPTKRQRIEIGAGRFVRKPEVT